LILKENQVNKMSLEDTMITTKRELHLLKLDNQIKAAAVTTLIQQHLVNQDQQQHPQTTSNHIITHQVITTEVPVIIQNQMD